MHRSRKHQLDWRRTQTVDGYARRSFDAPKSLVRDKWQQVDSESGERLAATLGGY